MSDNARRDYCFTAWKLPAPEYESIKYIVWGLERCPSTDREHYQGYVCFTRTHRMRSAKRIINGGNECHLEPRRGTRQQARDYCLKDGRVTEWGEFSPVTNKEIFNFPLERIKADYPEFFCRYHKGLMLLQDKGVKWRDIKVIVLWGEETGVGKTREAMSHNDVYKLDPPYTWWDGYGGEQRIVLDDYKAGSIPRGQLLNILDGYRLRLETKGSHTWASWTEVYITSNYNPHTWDDAILRRITEIRNVTSDSAVR